jgi:hypothetical protein
MVAAALAHEVPFTVRRNQIQQGRRHQGVVDEGIAVAQQAMGLEGEQLRIAGTGPHQIHGAAHGTNSRASIRN